MANANMTVFLFERSETVFYNECSEIFPFLFLLKFKIENQHTRSVIFDDDLFFPSCVHRKNENWNWYMIPLPQKEKNGGRCTVEYEGIYIRYKTLY